MSEEQVRRLPVLDRDERLVGMVSLGDLARETSGESAQQALEGVSAGGATSIIRCEAPNASSGDADFLEARSPGRPATCRSLASCRSAISFAAAPSRRRRPSRAARGSRCARRRRSCLRPCGLRRSTRASASVFGLGDDRLRLALGALDHGRGFLTGRLRLGLIFGLQRLGFLAQRFGLGQLLADRGDLAVERLPIAAGTFFQIRMIRTTASRRRQPPAR